jgi:uncharacterized protein YcbX
MNEAPVLSEINIYPIKSARGISVKTSQLVERGLRFDRRWMVVGTDGQFITQRQQPRLALIAPRIELDRMIVSAPGMEDLGLPLEMDGPGVLPVRVWDDDVQAVPAGAEARQWFSEFLGISCQPVYMPEDSIRPVDPDYALNRDQVSFADAFPALLISQASLDDLNSRLAAPVPMNRFRPNLVVTGCAPYAEDAWRKIRIGEVIFHLVKPCARCATTTVDQATGMMGKEPLATLAQYRKQNGKVLFGQNLLHENPGTIETGQPVIIIG